MIHSERSESARIGEAILKNINKGLCNNLNINQWKNTVLQNVQKNRAKQLYKFLMFNIKDCSISADTRRITKQDLN